MAVIYNEIKQKLLSKYSKDNPPTISKIYDFIAEICNEYDINDVERIGLIENFEHYRSITQDSNANICLKNFKSYFQGKKFKTFKIHDAGKILKYDGHSVSYSKDYINEFSRKCKDDSELHQKFYDSAIILLKNGK